MLLVLHFSGYINTTNIKPQVDLEFLDNLVQWTNCPQFIGMFSFPHEFHGYAEALPHNWKHKTNNKTLCYHTMIKSKVIFCTQSKLPGFKPTLLHKQFHPSCHFCGWHMGAEATAASWQLPATNSHLAQLLLAKWKQDYSDVCSFVCSCLSIALAPASSQGLRGVQDLSSNLSLICRFGCIAIMH